MSVLPLRVYRRIVKLVTKYKDFIHFIASHVSAVTKMIIKLAGDIMETCKNACWVLTARVLVGLNC